MKNQIDLLLKYMDMNFNSIPINKATTAFSLQCEMQHATFDYFLVLRESGTPPLLQFSIPIPVNVPENKQPDVLLFVSLMNLHRQEEPGNWIFDPAKAQLLFIYNWHCDVQNESFEQTFRHLFVKFIADADDSSEGLLSLLQGTLHPEEAVLLFANRNKACLN